MKKKIQLFSEKSKYILISTSGEGDIFIDYIDETANVDQSIAAVSLAGIEERAVDVFVWGDPDNDDSTEQITITLDGGVADEQKAPKERGQLCKN